jgi:hypothetical protein
MLPFGKLKPSTKLTWKSAPTRRPSVEAKDRPSRKKPAAAQADTPVTIEGRPVGSTYEGNVAKALWQLGWTFSYQVPLLGGRNVSGGQILDFLVNTVPVHTAVMVNGDYWHQDDQSFKNSQVMNALQTEGIPVKPEPLILTNKTADTYDAAFNFLNMALGKG